MSAAGVRVDSFRPGDEQAWQSFVARHRLATPFHTLAWKRSIERAFDYDSAYRLVRRDGDVVAVVPGFDCGGPFRSTVVNPFCEYGYPLVSPDVDVGSVLEWLRRRSGRLRTVMLKDADWTGIAGYNAHGFGGIETGTVRRLRVPGDFSTLTDHVFHRNLRRNVTTALESGLTVRKTDSVDDFYPHYLSTMKRRGSPQFPRSFFDALLMEFDTTCSLLVAESADRSVAGLLSLDHGGRRYLFSNGSRAEYLDARPNDLLYWRCIERACEADTDVVDFGRSEHGSGVDQFKSRFGGSTTRLTTLVSPPHRAPAGSIDAYRHLEPLARRLSSLVTHPRVGPRLKGWLHE